MIKRSDIGVIVSKLFQRSSSFNNNLSSWNSDISSFDANDNFNFGLFDSETGFEDQQSKMPDGVNT